MKLNLTKIASYPAPIRLAIFLLALLLVWLPLAVPIYFLNSDPNSVTILTMGLLFILFLILLKIWAKFVYQQPSLLKLYGLEGTRRNRIDFLNGLSLGFCFCLSLFIWEWGLGWLKFQTPSVTLVRLIAEGLLSGLGVALAEELLFRGWLLDELQRDYAPATVLWTNAIIFAILHFIKPLAEIIATFPQFPALILLGLTLVWAKRSRRNRLGICIGIHGGLVWSYYILNVGGIIKYSGQVSPLITGINGNPLAGVMGLLGLTGLAWWMRKSAIAV